MICRRCHTSNTEEAKFCTNCGTGLRYPSTAPGMPSNTDIYLLVAYIGWHFLSYLVYAVVNKVVVPGIVKNGSTMDIGRLYKQLDLVTTCVDIAFLVVLAALLKNNTAKIICLVYMALRLGLFILYSYN